MMIAAQVAKGESEPGIRKYMKEIKRVRDSTQTKLYQQLHETELSSGIREHGVSNLLVIPEHEATDCSQSVDTSLMQDEHELAYQLLSAAELP